MLTCLLAVALLLLSGSVVSGQDASLWEKSIPATARASDTPVPESGDRDVYSGTIRVFVVEQSSRWSFSGGTSIYNALLGLAMEEVISVNESDSLTWSLTWNGNEVFDANGGSYGDLTESDVKVIAAIYNSSSYTGYSDPPTGAPFQVHEVDATAGAEPGETGYNERNDDFTHSVLVEDGSTTW